MYYHPIIGITIFMIAIILSFFLGRLYLKKKLNLFSRTQKKRSMILPKGDITAPDAPWLKEK